MNPTWTQHGLDESRSWEVGAGHLSGVNMPSSEAAAMGFVSRGSSYEPWTRHPMSSSKWRLPTKPDRLDAHSLAERPDRPSSRALDGHDGTAGESRG